MRVGIDARCLNTAHLRGMGKYVFELVGHASPLGNVQWHFWGDRPESFFHKPSSATGTVELFDFKGYRFHAWEQIGLPWHASRSGVQVLHCTATTLPYWQPVPTIVTIHDTLPWHQPVLSPYENWYFHCLMPAALKKCAAVITISESSCRDILALWPWLQPKLHVIPHGVSDVYLQAETNAMPRQLIETIGGQPYLLYIGGALERKRFSWTLDILEKIKAPELRLLACGFSPEERRKARDSLSPSLRGRVFFLEFVEEKDMAELYKQAVAVLYPTLYEGFGFPALEAQAVGTPVLFSALGSLKELIGPGAEVLPPYDLDAWVRSCHRLLAERGTTRMPNEAARRWAKEFSWERSALRHLELYDQMAR